MVQRHQWRTRVFRDKVEPKSHLWRPLALFYIIMIYMENLRLLTIQRTINKMLNDRGYVLEKDNVRVLKFKKKEEKLLVFFYNEENINIKHFKTIFQEMIETNIHHAIIITKSITKFSKKISDAALPKFILEFFQEKELLYNITEHELVPKHTLLNSEEKQQILETLRCSDYQLPHMLINDPISRYYGLQCGQVVKIERSSETSGKYTAYRIVM